jgi:glucose/mannose-6-phosphate isomerase
MLDDANVIQQRDPEDALGVAANEWQQASYSADIVNGDHDDRMLAKIVIAGMGGSALAALLTKALLEEKLTIPLEIVREYDLPTYVGSDTLVIVSSCSGNTEETLGALDQARELGAQIAIMTSGGKLLEQAQGLAVAHVVLPDRSKIEPRMSTIAQMRALVRLLAHFDLVPASYYEEIASTGEWLKGESAQWTADVATDKNQAKQLALLAVGKTAVFYGGRLTGPLAYKWKISWNENAKNVAFWNVYPEANHNEFIGWSSHPIEKPFAVFDLKSSFEHERILKRFDTTDKLLSGKRPKATSVQLAGETPLIQLLWGTILADFVSIYVAILNGVDPTPVALVEKLKTELVK